MKKRWEVKKLGELYDITSSKRVFQSEWKNNGVPFYRAREIVKLAQQGFVENELFISEEMYNQYSTKYGIPKEGDIMVTGVGTLGICYVVKAGDKFYFKDGNIIWLKKKQPVNSRYIEYAFKSNLLRKQIDDSVGATVGTYTIIKAKSTQVPVPSLEEQEQIVSILDEAFAAIDQAKENVQRNLQNAKELFQSELNSIFSNKSEDWEEKTLNQISTNLDSKRVPITKNVRSTGNYPYYGASGIVDHVGEYLFDENLLLVSEDGANLLARTYPIAFSISGKAWVNNHAHVLKFNDLTSQYFVEYYLNSIKLDNYVSGMAQPKLNQKMLNTIPIPYPSVETQALIVNKLDRLSEETEKLENLYQQKLSYLAELKKSFLQKAFSGDLTATKELEYDLVRSI